MSDQGSSSNGHGAEAFDAGGADAGCDLSAPAANANANAGCDPSAPTANAGVPKPKRLACIICRKRKLKCDGGRPSCSTCARLGHACAYDEQRRKSGPKRGYVKALEERLKQVETLLKTQDPPPRSPLTTASPPKPAAVAKPVAADAGDVDARWRQSPQTAALDDFNFNANLSIPMANVGDNFTWEMIGLGLEEPLPPQATIDELHQVYFEKVHPSIPMIHRFRYLAAMNLAPSQRPPVCLRYAIWTMACAITDKFSDLKDLFYQRARKYVEADYVKGYGEHMISVAHCQTHILLACYEMKMMYFPRAWINTGSAVRLCQMIGLHRLDGTGLDVKQCLAAPKDWTEREERRRTFWMAFCEDRYASIGTGWPMTIDERDIMTRLPASDEAYDMSRPEQTQTLSESTSPSGVGKLSSFGAIVLLACLFGRNLVHLHRPDGDGDDGDDLDGPFWKRHRQMDGVLLNTSLCLPAHLKLPAGLSNPNVVFTNMSIHTSTICLHQAAIFKADKNKLGASVSAESKVRCIAAANEIAGIMRTISHMDLSAMNPFISFCLYVAARVFVQYLKSRPDDAQTTESLRFMLAAMKALKRRNPLTESFLVQLDVDFEALATRIPKLRSAFQHAGDSQGPSPNGLGPAWLSAEQSTMPGLTPTSGPAHDRSGSTSGGPLAGFGDGGGKAETGESPDDGPPEASRGPTPKSSGGAAQGARRLAPELTLGGGPGFEQASLAQQQALMGASFLGGPGGFTALGSGQPTAGFDMAAPGWADVGGHAAGMPPLGEGVLRALMNMGPMDAMDLSSWDTGNDAHL